MRIIFKYIIQSMKEKKFRTFLIVFAIMLSTALFFASVALSGTIEQLIMQRVNKYFGTADIIIHANERSPFWMFRLSRTTAFQKQLEYAVGAVNTSAVYKNRRTSLNINLYGFNLDDLQVMNPFYLQSQRQLQPFEGKKIIISQNTAQKMGLYPGDSLELLLDKAKVRFTVAGIAQPAGIFQEDGRSNTAVVPRETLAKHYGAPGCVSFGYLKVKDPKQLNQVLGGLATQYPRYTVRPPVSKEEIRSSTEEVRMPFFIALILVLFMSIFIIYSSFKVISRERLPVIGTFRSIGATRKATDAVMFMESGIYGVIGGIFGCLLGMGILYGMMVLIRPEWLKDVPIVIRFSVGQLIGAFGLAVSLPLFGAFSPIIKVSRIPVKDIVLNSWENPRRRKGWRLTTGLACLSVAGGVPWLAPPNWAFVIDIACMISAVAAVVILTPFLTSGFIKLFERLYEVVFGNEGVLAAKNLRGNKSIHNNIALLSIGISSLLMINTINFSVLKEVGNFFKDGTFQIWMYCYHSDRGIVGVLRSVAGVSGAMGVYGASGIEVDGVRKKVDLIQGIDPVHYLEYWNITTDGKREKLFNELDQGRTVLLGNVLKSNLGVKRGDWITFKMARGPRSYRVIGFFNSIMYNGNYALVSEKYLKHDMRLLYYDNLFVKTSQDPKNVAQAIQKKFQRYQPWVETMAKLTSDNLRSNQQILVLLQGFSVMTLVIGIFGVFNNLLISFLERKRSLAMMRSVGLSQNQTLKMILIESLTGGMIGGGVGLLAGTFLIWLLPFLLRAIQQNLAVHYSPWEYGIGFVLGVIITIVASIGPAFKSRKLHIIEAIKYE